MNSPAVLNKRGIGGKRVVIGQGVLEFPRGDVFNPSRIVKQGVLVFNVRGGAFICESDFDQATANPLIDKVNATTISSIKLLQPDGPDISLDNYKARLLKLSRLDEYTRFVFRFVNLTEFQLDKLNELTVSLPVVEENEEQHVIRLMKS